MVVDIVGHCEHPCCCCRYLKSYLGRFDIERSPTASPIEHDGGWIAEGPANPT